MRDEIRRALEINPGTALEERTIDITTTGRRSGQPRRIEIVFYRFGDSVYLSGVPSSRPRSWLLNLTADPHLTFHLKHGVVADLPATATVITDPAERRRILSQFVEEFNERRDPDGPWPTAVLDDWVEHSPLAKISFETPRDDVEPSPPTNSVPAVITKLSPWSVEDTVARLSAIVAARGLKLFTVVDHSGEAEAVGLELRDTKLVIFGSPMAGTPVMQAAPLAALDLPLKVLVWLDEHQTKLSYTAPSELAARYHLTDELANRLAAIDAITDAVIDR